jgi:PleD family two-component response regulator
VTATTGIGIAVRRPGYSPEALLGAARSALATAKRGGTGRVEVFGRDRRAESVKR